MVYQSQSAGTVAYKVQSGLGSPASGSGGTVLRTAGGTGGRMAKATTESNEVRSDGMRTRGRHGTQKTTGEWSGEFSMGSHEAIIEAIMRDTWDASDLVLTEADFTSLAIASNVITLGSGNPISLGLRVGDVIRLTLMSTAGNNSKNLRVVSLTSSTVTIAAGDVLIDQSADTACTLTRPKKLVQSGTLVKRYFTIDEYDADIDLSETMPDFVWGSVKFSMAANGLLMCDPGGAGTGRFTTNASGSSPVLTSPTAPTAEPLAVVDATIRIGGIDVVDLTSLDITLDIGPSAPDVFGSGAIKYSPDVFTGQMAVGINFGCLRKDLQFMSDYGAETVYSMHVLAVENESEPKSFLSIYVPNFTLGGVDKSALSKEGGARTQTISVPATLVGKMPTTSGYDSTMIKFQSTGV